MKILNYLAILTLITILSSGMLNAQDPSAIVDFESAEQGILVPRTDTASVNAAHTPAKGLLIFQNSDSTFYYFNGTIWIAITNLDADFDPTNEFQTLTKAGHVITLSDGGGSVDDRVLTESQVDGYVANNGYLTAEVDGDPANELQAISISDDTIFLSNGGFVKLPPDQVVDADSDPTNEFQDLLWNDAANQIRISDGTEATITGFLESEVDGDPTNELQNLAWNDASNELKIIGGNTETITGFLESEVDGDPTNELITDAQLIGDTLEITDAGGINKVGLGSLSNTLWNESGSNIYYDAGRVGISTMTPAQPLHVVGDMVLEQSNNPLLQFYLGSTYSGYAGLINADMHLSNLQNGKLYLKTQNAIRLTVDGSGNIGIGTTSPLTKLDVRGSALFNENSSDVDFRIESNNNSNMFFVDGGTDRIGIGTNTPNQTLDVRGGAVFNELGSTLDFRVEGDNDNHLLFVDANVDQVGIGTSNPLRKLHVVFDPPVNNINPIAQFQTTGATQSAASIRMQNTSTNYYTLGMTSPNATNANSFAIGHNANIGLSGDLITILPDGKMGLGINSPQHELHIDGTIRLEDGWFEIYTTGALGAQLYHDGTDMQVRNAKNGDLTLFTNNQARISITELGWVGINVTNPAEPLHVSGRARIDSGGSPELSLARSGTVRARLWTDGTDMTLVNTENGDLSFGTNDIISLVLDQSGNLGLGTTAPTQKLEIDGKLKLGDDITTPSAGVLRYNSTDSIFEGHDGIAWTNLSGGTGHWTKVSNELNYMDGNVGILVADPSFDLHVGGEVAIDGFIPTIYFRDDPTSYGLISSGEYGMRFNNQTNYGTDFDVNGDTRMTITPTGRVGIGTDNPDNMLHVIGDAHLEDASPRLGLYQSGVYVGYLVQIGDNMSLVNREAGNMYLSTNDVTRLTIQSDGDVGIGTTAPAEKLHVNGDMRISNSTPVISLYKGTTLASKIDHSGDDLLLANDGTGKIRLQVNGSTRVAITNGGAVGIGVLDPSYTLHVTGNEQYGGHFTNTYTGSSTKKGLYSEASDSGSGSKYGIEGKAIANSSHTTSDDIIGVKGSATVLATQSTTAILHGVYGSVDADGGSNSSALYGLSTGTDHYALWAQGHAHFAGQVRIGHTNNVTGYKLSVDGLAIVEELKVELSGDWPDYVLQDDYELTPLDQLEQQINETGHLPGVPSADEVEKDNGFHVGEMNRILLEKVEELTLYIIQQQKEIDDLKQQLKGMNK